MTFPPLIAAYLEANCIDPKIYCLEGRKYFYSCVSLNHLREDAVGEAELVACDNLVPRFYSVSHSFAFSSSKLYRDGMILPMDIGSGLAVSLLELKPSDHVLDLCCAPGGKLVLAGLLMGRDFNTASPQLNGSLTGVDIAGHRLATCRSLLKKFKIPRTRLFCADGTKFEEMPLKFTEAKASHNSRMKPFHETTDYRKRPTIQSDSFYDKVLVDAQCTHDGSIKHIQKHMKTGWDGFDLDQFAPNRLEELYSLQLNLLESGFRMLQPGGTIIYSTCSLSRRQNQDIVTAFLSRHGNAVPYHFADSNFYKVMAPPEFDSGFFLARFKKL